MPQFVCHVNKRIRFRYADIRQVKTKRWATLFWITHSLACLTAVELVSYYGNTDYASFLEEGKIQDTHLTGEIIDHYIG